MGSVDNLARLTQVGINDHASLSIAFGVKGTWASDEEPGKADVLKIILLGEGWEMRKIMHIRLE